MISSSTLDFLRELSQNNQREWFQENKTRYDRAHANLVDFAEALHEQLSTWDDLVSKEGKKMLFRIYRDIRFSPNKAPYKTHMSGYLERATEALRGGYYFEIKPGATYQGGGFFQPEKEDLLRIRTAIAQDHEALFHIIQDPLFQKFFGQIQGESLKTAPKGFPKDHPAIDLIKMKSFTLGRTFSDDQVCAEGFVQEMVAGYRAMRPFLDYMTEVLTSDGNGLPL